MPTIDLEGDPVEAKDSEPIASALFGAGHKVFARSIKYHRPRGPYCFQGACSHCLMRVDGVPNVFTCRTPARDGMRIERQNAYPSVEVDVFRSIDWLFPRGLDHHAMFAGVPVAEKVMAKVARQLAGLGLLPEKPAPLRLPAEREEVPVAIVGGGPAGRGAAEALTEAKVTHRLLARPEASAIGFFDEGGQRFLAAASTDRIVLVFARAFLFAHGGTAPLPPFEGNDLPGVFSARAARTLLRWGRVPGQRVVCVGLGPGLALAAKEHRAPAYELPALVAAHGRTALRGITIRDGKGRPKKVACDALVLALPEAPSFELPRQAGAHVVFDDRVGFVVRADVNGKTAAPDAWVAGQLTGPCSPSDAADSGRRAARAIAEALR